MDNIRGFMERLDQVGETLNHIGDNMLIYVTIPCLILMVIVYIITRDRLH